MLFSFHYDSLELFQGVIGCFGQNIQLIYPSPSSEWNISAQTFVHSLLYPNQNECKDI